MKRWHGARLLCCLGLPVVITVPVLAAEPAAGKAVRTVITRTSYAGRQSFRLTDGKTEAVVVPSLGRVMRYGRVGGTNFLWNNSVRSFKPGAWRNWGGDKTWLAPQAEWPVRTGRAFPPDDSFDGAPHVARVLGNGHLLMTGPPSLTTGIQVSREFWFAADGDFLIKQTAKKTTGAPLRAGIWNVTQIPPDVDAVFMPLNPDSPYKQNVYWFTGPDPDAKVTLVSPTLLRYQHTAGASYKLGADSPVAAIAAVKGGQAFVESAPHPQGQYPDGAVNAGFPVEIWNNGDPQTAYTEMELLSPLVAFHVGDVLTHTLRWRIRSVPDTNPADPELAAAVQKLLLEPAKTAARQ